MDQTKKQNLWNRAKSGMRILLNGNVKRSRRAVLSQQLERTLQLTSIELLAKQVESERLEEELRLRDAIISSLQDEIALLVHQGDQLRAKHDQTIIRQERELGILRQCQEQARTALLNWRPSQRDNVGIITGTEDHSPYFVEWEILWLSMDGVNSYRVIRSCGEGDVDSMFRFLAHCDKKDLHRLDQWQRVCPFSVFEENGEWHVAHSRCQIGGCDFDCFSFATLNEAKDYALRLTRTGQTPDCRTCPDCYQEYRHDWT